MKLTAVSMICTTSFMTPRFSPLRGSGCGRTRVRVLLGPTGSHHDLWAQWKRLEIHHLASGSRAYHWVFEADITACFDEISHSALMGRVRRRIGDKRVLALVKSFLKAGILSKDLSYRDSPTGTPQGGSATRGRTVVSGCTKGGSMVMV
jgi:hypothetical protein